MYFTPVLLKSWRTCHQSKNGGGVTALLASTLAFSHPASAINITVQNTALNTTGNTADSGQSFRNDPAGTGATIFLDTWTFGFTNSANQTTAAATTLTIYNGTGNGGTIVGTSTSTATGTFAGLPSVTWTFPGSLPIVDNLIYTAVLAPTLGYGISTSNPYPNGVLTVGTFPVAGEDRVFRGVFSATPVPFEFSPVGGVIVLGGLWASKRFRQKN
ncbi:MAG: hypothetical protein SFT94_05260 [Pseudanabaenaceae cyanobacterium bins.68]|nr:hypothetical protein [Pseudanabaenaceae cyanobacterium bins.68]